MRIAIDGSAIPKQMAGAGVYTFQLVHALAAEQTDHEFVVFARNGLFNDLQGAEVVHIPRTGRGLRLGWEQVALPFLLRRHKIDVLHSPHHHTPTFVGPGIKRVVTVNDVTFLILPERYPPVRRAYMTAVTRVAAHVADALIVPSNTVRADVIERLHVSEDRVHVIPDAQGPQFRPASQADIERIRASYNLEGRYILSVGSLEPGKNRTRLINAFTSLADRHSAELLVIVGQPAWNYAGDRELAEQAGLGRRIRFLGYVPDEDLPALYTGAVLSAFPSLYEGFGIPVLEAMACGTPVITSSVGSTKEVAAEAALLVDPYDVDAISNALGLLLEDEEARLDLVARGIERAKSYSWERTARETLKVYERVMGS